MSANLSATAAVAAAELKFGQVGIANVRVHKADPELLRAALEVRVHEAPALFSRAPLVVDLSFLASLPEDGVVRALFEAVRAAGMLPVGLAYGDAATDALAQRLGVPSIAKFRTAYERAAQSTPTSEHGRTSAPQSAATPPATRAATGGTALQHFQPVRTGQQVYAQGADLIVVGTVANGAEVLADGNVHVYGTLRGRAFAGATGEKSARIFCREFRAEIVSIAGHYRVFEELPDKLAGQAVQIRLENDKLQITPF